MRAPLNQSTGKQKTNTLERHLKRMAGAGAPKHTIVLLQETASKSTRTFSDFESVADAMNGICQLYEQRLKQMNPGRLPHLLPPLARRHADQRIERALHVGQGPLRAPDHAPGSLRAGCSTPYVRTV